MTAQTLNKAFVPLPGGATAVYTSTGLAYYRHSDWLGSSRLATAPSRTPYYTGAYAPFGENYKENGTTDRSFTDENQDTVGGAAPLYDFMFREQTPNQGRWISPDPAGLAAVSLTDPQSWNRYAYVMNDPLLLIDPLGLDCLGPNGSYPCDHFGNKTPGAPEPGENSGGVGYWYFGGGSHAPLQATDTGGGSVGGDDSSIGKIIKKALKHTVCTSSQVSSLIIAAKVADGTVGAGFGGSAGIGLILGVSGTAGIQVVADSKAHVGIAITYG